MEPTEVLSRVAENAFSIRDDYFHIVTDTGKIVSANEDEVAKYLSPYVNELVEYLESEPYGHTGDEVLDRIIDSDTGTLFDDEFNPVIG